MQCELIEGALDVISQGAGNLWWMLFKEKSNDH